jgi:hypothetical protein
MPSWEMKNTLEIATEWGFENRLDEWAIECLQEAEDGEQFTMALTRRVLAAIEEESNV